MAKISSATTTSTRTRPRAARSTRLATGTFDSFNPYIVRGAAAAGFAVQGFGGGLLYDTLMEQSTDEPSASHPLIAEAFKYPDDYSSATYRLDPRAKWHDGKPITAEDVVWSFDVLKDEHAQLQPLLRQCDGSGGAERPRGRVPLRPEGQPRAAAHHRRPRGAAEALVGGDRRQTARSATSPSRRWSRRSARAPTRSKASSRGRRSSGAVCRTIGQPTVGANVGRDNFDRRRYVYIQDDNAEWQAFTKGGYEDVRPETSSRRWATGYKFPAFKAGDVIKKEFATTSGEPMQGFVMNLRRPQFQDRRVRAGADLGARFREDEPHAVLRPEHPHRQLFREQRAGLQRPAAGQGTRNPGRLQGQAAARTVHAGIQAAGLRHAAGGTAEPAPGRPAVRRGRLEDQGRQDASTTRPASSSRSSSSATTRPTR